MRRPVLSLQRTKHEAGVHHRGRPLSIPSPLPGQGSFQGFAPSYRDAITEVEQARYITRRAIANGRA